MIKQYKPLITIVIPVYNGANFVAQAIESALAQTYEKIEIIVVNDGSPDNSEEVIRPYMDRIRYFKKENGGVSTALNYAIREMKGVWLSWLSHDDLYLHKKIERQVQRLNEIIEEHPGCDIEKYVLSCQDQRIDEKGRVLPHRLSKHPEYSNPFELVAKEVCNYSIGGCTVLAAKTAYESMGGFDENNRTISDADMWFKLILNGYTFDFSNEVLVQSRYHKGMVSIQRGDLVSEEKRKFYCSTISTVLPYIDESMKQNIALSMIKANIDEAANLSINACESKCIMLSCSILYAKAYRKGRMLLRDLYRRIRWR